MCAFREGVVILRVDVFDLGKQIAERPRGMAASGRANMNYFLTKSEN